MVLRTRGPCFALKRAWRRYGFGRDGFVILVAPLRAHVGTSLPNGMTVAAATPTDLRALASLASDAKRIQAVLDGGGGWLHVARDGDRLIGYRLATREFHGFGILANVMRLEPGQVYIDHIFVHPDYRRQHVGRQLMAVQNADLLRLGIREYVAATRADNVPSLRLTLQGGGRPLLFVDSVRRFFYHRRHVSRTMPRGVRRLIDEVRS
jgi:GNAT superfamily N-acetyltransferase